MIIRIVLVGALIAATMVAVKDGRLLRDAGLKGSCKSVVTRGGEVVFWEACTKGKLDGRPNLARQGCKAVAIKNGLEWWHCPAALGASRAAS
jgi:hypothetical protein